MALTFLLFRLAVCFSIGTAAIENVLQQDCLLIFSETQYEDGSTDSQVECELRGEDLQGSYHKFVKVDGLTVDLAQASGVESGVTTLFAEDAVIDSSESLLEIPANGEIQLGITDEDVSNRNLRGILNRKLRTGTKTVLVLRAVAADVSTTASESELSDDIFGTSGDVVNLKSQYALCSDGKLQFQPLTTNALVGEDGVYTVNLPSITVTGATRETIRNAMIDQAAADLGVSLNTIADHVMACIPRGTANSWIGNGDVNSWRTMYNDNWCRYPSIQLHEIGHNMNLAHSNEGTVAYDDKSCLMGFSYQNDEIPRMCFNGAKTYQLGWYSQYHLDIPITEPFNWNGNLIGFAEKANAASDDKMIVRIITSTIDIYVHFNRKIGMNEGTQEGGNQVLVTTRDTGTGFALSDLVAKLNAFDSYTVPESIGGGRTITIQVFSISTGSVPGLAIISIQFSPLSEQTLAPTPFPTFLPTNQPTIIPLINPTPPPTNQPTNIPTGQPTSDPTKQPTSNPTNQPTSDPTNQPTSDPTNQPTSDPTNHPSTYPTSLPSNFPTSLPSNFPTNQPSNFPTSQPSNYPSAFPTRLPTSIPTNVPTSQPTPNPTKAPTTSTKKPTANPTKRPTKLPTKIPSKSPTKNPTRIPTLQKKRGQTVNTYSWLFILMKSQIKPMIKILLAVKYIKYIISSGPILNRQHDTINPN